MRFRNVIQVVTYKESDHVTATVKDNDWNQPVVRFENSHTVKTDNGGGTDHEQTEPGCVLLDHFHGYARYDEYPAGPCRNR